MTEPDAERDLSPDEGQAQSEGEERDARQELFEAIDHFKNAASLFFERASRDPAVKTATHEAERIFHKIGERAEPLARQLTDEIDRLTKRIGESLGSKKRD